MFIAACDQKTKSRRGGIWREPYKMPRKITKLTPMVRFPNRTIGVNLVEI